MIIGAYCVCWVHNTLPYIILLEAYCVGTVQYRIIVMVYYSKLDNAICLEFVEKNTTAPKDMK